MKRVWIIAFVDQGMLSAGNFLAGVLMARAFGAYQFGWFALSWVIVEFMASLQFAAVLQPMLNIGAKEEKASTTKYYTATAAQQVMVATCSALIVWAGVKIAATVVDAEFGHLALPLCLCTAALQGQNFMRRLLFARDRPVVALVSDGLRIGLQVSALAALLFFGEAATGELGIWIAAGACAMAALVGLPFFGRFEWDRRTFRDVLARHWTFSKWLLPSAVLFWMTTQGFVIMSGIVLGAATTGELRAASSIVGLIIIIFQALDNFAPTQASRTLHRAGGEELLRYMARLSGLTALLVAAFVALINYDPDWLVQVIYGSGYKDLGYVIRWLSAASCAYGAAVLLGIWAAAIEQTRMIFCSYAFAAIFTAVACYPMTRYLGIDGVVAGCLVVELIKALTLAVVLARWRAAIHLPHSPPSRSPAE